MDFGAVHVDDAEGAILAHSVRAEGLHFRKGVVLGRDHCAALRAAGVARVVVARLGPRDVHEDAAATRLADAVLGRPACREEHVADAIGAAVRFDPPAGAGSPDNRAPPAGTVLAAKAADAVADLGGDGAPHLRASVAATGRVNLYATRRGVACVDRARVDAINRIDPAITLATLPEWQHLQDGAMVATIKIIAYGVDGGALTRAVAMAGGALRIAPTALRSATLIETHLGSSEGASDKGARAIAGRMETLGLSLAPPVDAAHAEGALAEAIAAANGDVVLILTASATSDSRDVAPAALRRAGGHVLHYGMPVDPGNLLFLGEIHGRPVVGLPGCARSPALNGADWVLERIACGVPVTPEHITGLGVGGLLKEIPTRPRPREARTGRR